jgi:hypothetical protein
MAFEFVLEAFESTVTMTQLGELDSTAVPALDANAEAVLQVNLAHMRNVFKYQTDSADITDANENDLKYYVNTADWPTTLNPANAVVDTDAITTNGLSAPKLMVAHDFTRYLAEELFGTHQGVDLFNNELELLNNLRTICGYASAGQTWFDILAKLTAVNTASTSGNMVTDAAGNYTTNAYDNANNICRVLHRQMASVAPGRFNPVDDVATPQPLPFMEDDVISFKLIINPANNQHLLTSLATAIAPRSYKIKLLMKASPANTAVGEDEPAV